MRTERFKTPLFPLEFSRVRIVRKDANSEPGTRDERVYQKNKNLMKLGYVQNLITESIEIKV